MAMRSPPMPLAVAMAMRTTLCLSASRNDNTKSQFSVSVLYKIEEVLSIDTTLSLIDYFFPALILLILLVIFQMLSLVPVFQLLVQESGLLFGNLKKVKFCYLAILLSIPGSEQVGSSPLHDPLPRQIR